MDTPLSLCARCSQLGKTCCQRCEVYVTPGDVQRITARLGRVDFFHYAKAPDDSYFDLEGDPTWTLNVFREDGTRRILKRRENGDCSMLGPQGCLLSLEERPLVCRLYPFVYTARSLRQGEPVYCPPVLLDNCPCSVLEAMGMDIQDAVRWHRQLYQEITQERESLRAAV